ncbi:Bgt-1620 [Blumeria graminis f. sp. tritici]|uniref:Bgt-1620 n=1 Tax=Blumeria graminis f. sp. tritici TaxID=62690 RepID=A0A9X9MGQ2_BLUGR|nr:Bgt-1620 [Blumeria graminis f. sp. tritici]
MRRATAIFIVINATIILYLLHACSTLIGLLFEDGAADIISSEEIPALETKWSKNSTQLIPKIIHQTYINESIPSQWILSQKSCLNLHQDYEYKVESRNFIASQFPWFLKNFDDYPYAIQRADAIRYFVLAHFGGIYIDLDDGCNRRLDPLLAFPAWLRRTVPTGISNDAMGSVPQHPFFLKAINSLQTYQRNWGAPYLSVMYSTGPLFLSVLWKEYMHGYRPAEEHVRILTLNNYKGFPESFFNVTKGNSWHREDAKAVLWMGKHWMLLTVSGFAAAIVIGSFLWMLWNRIFSRPTKSRRWKSGAHYELVDRQA